jgi:hypothetical protein
MQVFFIPRAATEQNSGFLAVRARSYPRFDPHCPERAPSGSGLENRERARDPQQRRQYPCQDRTGTPQRGNSDSRRELQDAADEAGAFPASVNIARQSHLIPRRL